MKLTIIILLHLTNSHTALSYSLYFFKPQASPLRLPLKRQTVQTVQVEQNQRNAKGLLLG